MRVLLTGKHFPMAGMNYFRFALEELGHEVFSFGYYSGNTVPWPGNPAFPQYYVFPPDLALPQDIPVFPTKELEKHLPWKPDLILQIDAGFHLEGGIKGVPNALFATDPHFLDYMVQYKQVDFFFNPQPSQFEKYPKGIFLPWAYDPNVHRVMSHVEKEYDIVFIGAVYENRKKALDALSKICKVYIAEPGIIFEECTELYNKGKISFNWSSNDDIPMRIFEGMAYGNMVVTNRLTGLDLLFKEDKHYIGFDNIPELLQKVQYYLNHEEKLDRIALNGYMEIEEHTYKERCKTILKTIFG